MSTEEVRLVLEPRSACLRSTHSRQGSALEVLLARRRLLCVSSLSPFLWKWLCSHLVKKPTRRQETQVLVTLPFLGVLYFMIDFGDRSHSRVFLLSP